VYCVTFIISLFCAELHREPYTLLNNGDASRSSVTTKARNTVILASLSFWYVAREMVNRHRRFLW